MGTNTDDVLFVSILAVILFRNQIFTMLFLNGAVRIQFYHTFFTNFRHFFRRVKRKVSQSFKLSGFF